MKATMEKPEVTKVEELQKRRIGKCHNRPMPRTRPDFEYYQAGLDTDDPALFSLTAAQYESLRWWWSFIGAPVLVLLTIAAIVLWRA